MIRILPILIALAVVGCSTRTDSRKPNRVISIGKTERTGNTVGFSLDSLNIPTQPRNVLLTSHAIHRLTPIYKVNFNERTGRPFTGGNAFQPDPSDYGQSGGNNWNNNFMPGFEAVQGYNLLNITHYNSTTQTEHLFFDEPVLVNTLYYPAYSNDTLNFAPIRRDFYMVSAYDSDTNKDRVINRKDLRRFYHFDLDANVKTPLIPKEYSVMSSEYDPENDVMYVFARLDENQNGQSEYAEPTHIFWIDLQNPENRGPLYGREE